MRFFTLAVCTVAVFSAREVANPAYANPDIQSQPSVSSNTAERSDTQGESEHPLNAISLPERSITPEFSQTPQVTPVHQLADVHPDDWAAQTLQSLNERYGCMTGYSDAMYRGDRPVTRSEFAAGLQTCLEAANQLTIDVIDDLAVHDPAFQRLLEDFQDELDLLENQIDSQEGRLAMLQLSPFSTTTQLRGRVIFTLLDAFGDDTDVNATLSQRATIDLNTSFFGHDRLGLRLRVGNGTRLDDATGFNEPRLGFDTNTDNEVRASVKYVFSVGDNIEVSLSPNRTGVDTFTDVINPFFRGSGGAISRFARRNTIYRVPDGNAGIGASIRLNEAISVDFGYAAGEAPDAEEGEGFFNGNYGVIGQLTLTPGDRLAMGLTYIHAYAGAGDGIRTGTGSQAASLEELGPAELERPVVSNSYGIQANYEVSDRFNIGGWFGHTSARAIGLGDATVSNWAVTLAFPDLGREGNVGGIMVGMQPRLTSVSQGLRTIGQEPDSDVGLHIEGFYRHEITDNIEITPGFIWITAPDHNNGNSDIVVATIRTLFRF